MEALQFCYWLQGFAELNSGDPPNEKQWQAIRDHLQLVFEKKTPAYGHLAGPGITYRKPEDLSGVGTTSIPAIATC